MPLLCSLAVVQLFVLHAAQVQVCWSDKGGDSKAKVAIVNLTDASNLLSNLGARGAGGVTKSDAWGAGPNWRASAHEGHGDKVTSVGFSADGARIVSGSLDKSVQLCPRATLT